MFKVVFLKYLGEINLRIRNSAIGNLIVRKVEISVNILSNEEYDNKIKISIRP